MRLRSCISKPMDLLAVQKNILNHTLPHVPFDGWAQSTLEHGANSAGVDTVELHRAFPGGARDAVRFFVTQADEALDHIPLTPDMRLPEKIEALILGRLQQNLPQREAVRKAVAFLSLPQHADLAMESLYRTTDRMWKITGDHPTDFSFYTKRLSLGAIYSATLLHWLNDTSENQHETTLFLKRRLNDLNRFHRFRKSLSTFTLPFSSGKHTA